MEIPRNVLVYQKPHISAYYIFEAVETETGYYKSEEIIEGGKVIKCAEYVAVPGSVAVGYSHTDKLIKGGIIKFCRSTFNCDDCMLLSLKSDGEDVYEKYLKLNLV